MINKDNIQYFAKEYPRDYPEPESIVAVLKRKKKKVREILSVIVPAPVVFHSISSIIKFHFIIWLKLPLRF